MKSFGRFSKKKDLQKKIVDTKFEAGWTMTAMAMEKALASYKKQQRKDKNTARVSQGSDSRK